MNKYMNINRIEFAVTNSCTSRCKHCSLGKTLGNKDGGINKTAATAAITELARIYTVESVMTFGGEPLLYADTTCAIHETAKNCGIASRQLITNGYFTNDTEKIKATARALKENGVNSLLLSVDAFHAENIPLAKVYPFAKALRDENIVGFKLHPAWVVNCEHNNRYNQETNKCLRFFDDLHIPVSRGNNIFPAGNAAIYLSEFYEKNPIDINFKCGESRYTNALDNVSSIFIAPNGDVMICSFIIGNICRESILDIVKRYNPKNNSMMSALMNGGIKELVGLAKNNGIEIDASEYYSACSVCREIVKRMNN